MRPTIFKRFTAFFLLLTVMSLYVKPTLADIQGETLRVNSYTILRKNDSPHFYSNIVVDPGGVLEIEAGVHVQIGTGGSFVVHGELKALGTLMDRIYIEPLQSDSSWQGLYVASDSPKVSLEFVIFKRFIEPVYLEPKEVILNNLTFEDGVYNVLHIGSSSSHYADITLDYLNFKNRLQGRRMKDNGVFLEGIFGNIRINHVTIHDLRVTELQQWHIGIWIKATRKGLMISNTEFSVGCSIDFLPPMAGEDKYVGINPSFCHPEKLPVIFLPGYGASVNLPHLAKPLPAEPKREGWRFLTPVTEPYKYMLDSFMASKVPFSICFYDWRLPSSQIVEEYLLPKIEEVKSAHHVDAVKIVAHSYGGTVARAYVQSSEYQGDVYQVIQVGTPNQGAAKAYPVWEGGILPGDWQVLGNLVRYYSYVTKNSSQVQTLRSMFPSVKELLPIYPALYYKRTQLADPSLQRQANTFLLSLRNNLENFIERTKVTTIRSEDQVTVTTLRLKVPPAASKIEWPDGDLYLDQPDPIQSGDGTVPGESVLLTGATNLIGSGSHAQLTATTVDAIFTELGFKRTELTKPQLTDRSASNMLWFVFDCPVRVRITLPDGREFTSDQPIEGTGEYDVAASDEIIWLLLPKLPGTYSIQITGLADTPVRYWVNDEPIHEITLRKDETVNNVYSIDGQTNLPDPVASSEIKSETPDTPSAAVLLTTPDKLIAPTNPEFTSTNEPQNKATEVITAQVVNHSAFLLPPDSLWLDVTQPRRFPQHQDVLPVLHKDAVVLPHTRKSEYWLSFLIALNCYLLFVSIKKIRRYCRTCGNVPP